MQQKGIAHILLLLAAVGVITFLLISRSASFKDPLFSALFPKSNSFAQTATLGDIDHSGKIDIFDFNLLLTDFGKTDTTSLRSDIDGNGKVDIFDFNILLTNFGKTVSSTCTLNSLSWEYPLSQEGQMVSLVAKATGDCVNQQLNLTIKETKAGLPDTNASNQPNQLTVPFASSGGTNFVATSSWMSDPWHNACLVGSCDPQYFATGNIVSDSTTIETTAPRTIQVTKTDTADMYPLHNTFKERIPDFGTQAYLGSGATIITSKQSGNWTDPNTWNGGVVPNNDNNVQIMPKHTVVYDGIPTQNIRINHLKILEGGELKFKTDITTRLTVGTAVVLGSLEIGNQYSPVQTGKIAELIIADKPLDINAASPAASKDPNQFGTGLLVLKQGKLRMHGDKRVDDISLSNQNSHAFIRLTQEPQAGATTLQSSEDVNTYNWKVGDKLILPDSNQTTFEVRELSYTWKTEKPTISAVSADGKTITLTSALQYAHPGAKDANGAMKFLPHVGNLTRNIIVRSANPNGTRGHILLSERADADVRYAGFYDLGRTKAEVPLDSAVYDASGNVTKIGTNHVGRYSFHFHHDSGVARNSAQQTDTNIYQEVFVGNAVDEDNKSKWGVTIHNTHYGLIKNNTIASSRGSGIMLEAGNEYKNIIEGNFVVDSRGLTIFSAGGFAGDIDERGDIGDFANEGSGIWIMSPFNSIRNNTIASTRDQGIATYFATHVDKLQNPRAPMVIPSKNYQIKSSFVGAGQVIVPYNDPNIGLGSGQDVRGADLADTTQTSTVNTGAQRNWELKNNETYGVMERGIHIWGGGPGEILDTARVWHTAIAGVELSWRDGDGVFNDFEASKLKNITVRGDVSKLSNARYSNFEDPCCNTGPIGVYAEFAQYVNNVRIENSDIQGMRIGIHTGTGTIKTNNTFLKNYINLRMYYASSRFLRSANIANTTFESLPGVTLSGQTQKDFYLIGKQASQTLSSPSEHFHEITNPDLIQVYNYKSDGTSYPDFRLYRLEQAANFNLKNSDEEMQSLTIMPSITNQQLWDQYGDAIGYDIAPCSTQLPKIRGYACPLTNTATNPRPVVAIDYVIPQETDTTASSIDFHFFVNPKLEQGRPGTYTKTVSLPNIGINYITITDADVPAGARLQVLDLNGNGVVDANEQFKRTFMVIRN